MTLKVEKSDISFWKTLLSKQLHRKGLLSSSHSSNRLKSLEAPLVQRNKQHHRKLSTTHLLSFECGFFGLLVCFYLHWETRRSFKHIRKVVDLIYIHLPQSIFSQYYWHFKWKQTAQIFVEFIRLLIFHQLGKVKTFQLFWTCFIFDRLAPRREERKVVFPRSRAKFPVTVFKVCVYNYVLK